MVILISYIDGVISYIGGVISSYVGLNVGRHNSYMSVLTHPVEHTCDMYYVTQFNGCTYLLHRRCYLLHWRRYLLCISFLESLPPFQLRRANPHSANHGQQGKSAAKSRERSKIYRNRNVRWSFWHSKGAVWRSRLRRYAHRTDLRWLGNHFWTRQPQWVHEKTRKEARVNRSVFGNRGNVSTPAPKKKKSRQQAPQHTTTEESGSKRNIPSTASADCKEVQQIDPKKIKKLDKLGQGSQAVVFKGSWEGTLVALKTCEFDCDADKQTITKAIADEASVHYGLRHPNVT